MGGFDECLLVSEDMDYCFRAQLAGVTLHFVPGAVVHVRNRETLSALFQQARLWAQYQVLLYKRYRQLTGMNLAHPWVTYLERWEALFWRLPQLRTKAGRAAWLRSLGWQIGKLEGSLRHRIRPF